MKKTSIRYKDWSGDTTERTISDIQPEGSEAINAFCHTRNARRTFKIANILIAFDPETGEVIENFWKEFGMANTADGRERLESLVAQSIPSIKALKFFSLIERGFAKKERRHLLQFIKQHHDISMYSDDEVDTWLQQLWCGDYYAYRDGNTSEYELLLDSIPMSLRTDCRATALTIAAGSKRQRLEPEQIDRINREFGP